jgi:hypothetical protein
MLLNEHAACRLLDVAAAGKDKQWPEELLQHRVLNEVKALPQVRVHTVSVLPHSLHKSARGVCGSCLDLSVAMCEEMPIKPTVAGLHSMHVTLCKGRGYTCAKETQCVAVLYPLVVSACARLSA